MSARFFFFFFGSCFLSQFLFANFTIIYAHFFWSFLLLVHSVMALHFVDFFFGFFFVSDFYCCSRLAFVSKIWVVFLLFVANFMFQTVSDIPNCFNRGSSYSVIQFFFFVFCFFIQSFCFCCRLFMVLTPFGVSLFHFSFTIALIIRFFFFFFRLLSFLCKILKPESH